LDFKLNSTRRKRLIRIWRHLANSATQFFPVTLDVASFQFPAYREGLDKTGIYYHIAPEIFLVNSRQVTSKKKPEIVLSPNVLHVKMIYFKQKFLSRKKNINIYIFFVREKIAAVATLGHS
jgi:hypothetical protein